MTNLQFAILNSTIFIAAAQIAPNPFVPLLQGGFWLVLAIISRND